MLTTELIRAEKEAEPRLMIALHGLGDSMEGYRWLPHAMQFPWLNYLLVNAPDRYYTGFSWYPFDDDPGPGIERSRKLLFELLDQMRAQGFATEKTVLFGFSQGCLMSMEVGARYPHRLAGIMGVSGYVHEPERLLRELSPQARQQRFLITHGTRDPLIPIEQVRPQLEMLRQAGLRIDWREFVKAHTIDDALELSVLRDFVRDSYV
ncbi:MAG TPA: serine esterase [Verrucomicrobiae bacterium]|nr:serine esterase [Verrucomicrobiae bacterium]